MAVGLKVWDAAGNLVFDSSVKISRLLATINVGTSDGSQSFVWPNNLVVAWAINYSGSGVMPKVSVAGGVVSWAFGNASGIDRSSCTILVLGY